MNIFFYLFRTLYRIKWWLLIFPAILAAMAIYYTRNMDHQYGTDMTIYTGIISGSGTNPGDEGGSDWHILNNSLNNVINTINSKETLKRLSLLLYARCMIYGDPKNDNIYISAKHYRQLLAITPKSVQNLIDKNSEENTVENLKNYEEADPNNFVYGLFNWNHPYFSFGHLRDKIQIRRIDNSDILHVTYQANDPSIAFQTLSILSDIYADEYSLLQYRSTNNVVKYFSEELARIGKDLREQEDSLTTFNIESRVINYDKQTEAITSLDTEYELQHQRSRLAYNNAQVAIKHLEAGMDANLKAIKNNSEFLMHLQQIASVNYDISKIESFHIDSSDNRRDQQLRSLNNTLKQQEQNLHDFMQQYSAQRYTRDGYPNANFVTQWVDELLKLKKAESEIEVAKEFKEELDGWYDHYSPVGSLLKRKERNVDFIERNYLSILGGLNSARLRLKSIEMNSATLKVINPPTLPLNSLRNNRRVIVAGVYFGSIAFILGVSLLIAFFDRTLKDKTQTERITGAKVAGAFPKVSSGKNFPIIEKKAIHALANQLYGHYNSDHQINFINLFRLSTHYDQSRITELLLQHWFETDIKAKAYYEGADFQAESRSYLIEQDLLNHIQQDDLSLIQHAALKDSPIPNLFLEKAMVNVLVVPANSVWTPEEELILNDLISRAKGTPVLIYLIGTDRYAVEEFTGMLPPFTFFRRLEYRLSNFGLTSLGK